MSNEELQGKMEFIVNQQAQFSVNIQRLELAHLEAEKRVGRLERVLKLAIRACRRDRIDFRERYNVLVAAQIKTEEAGRRNRESIQALIDSRSRWKS